MIEAVMLWNEPNNMSHWDFGLDPGWRTYAEMVSRAGAAVRAERPGLTRVLGGMSPIDPCFVANLAGQGGLDEIDVVAVHGFPLDWNLWSVDDWPAKLDSIRRVTDRPVWVTEVGVSTYANEEVQRLGLERTARLLEGRAERVHWYSLFDLPREWGATTRHKEREGSSYFRHFHMGLIRPDGSPKRALQAFAAHAPALGLCQWFHYEDPRLDDAVRWFRELGVTKVRTGLAWSDDHDRPDAQRWFDRQMAALEPFDVTLTFCFTPEQRGLSPHHTSPPRDVGEFADFCARMVRRYG
ncbi:MAG TPA: glycosyl hydrolase [Longimicrobiaceae bacterium]|nr:glycosyl hydrolase [Longimicrobiaceae bacterium]